MHAKNKYNAQLAQFGGSTQVNFREKNRQLFAKLN